MVPNYKINSKTLDSLNDTNLYDVSEDYMFSFENQQTIREKLIKKYGKDYMKKLNDNFKVSNIARNISNLIQNDNDLKKNYSGIYLDDNNNLIILSNKIFKLEKFNNEIKGIPNEKRIINKIVEYTYDELNIIYNELNTFTKNNRDQIKIGFYIDEIENRVVVEAEENEDVRNKVLESVTNSSLIKFENLEKHELYSNFNPGDAWNDYINIKRGGVGYRARTVVGGVEGFVTTGHNTPGLNKTIKNLGIVEKYKFTGDLDAAWINTTTTGKPTNTLNTPKSTDKKLLSTDVVTKFIVGETYAMLGGKSGFNSGKVTTTNYTSPEGISKLIKTDFLAERGDSGSIVFKYPDVNLDGGYKTAGIIQGGIVNKPITYFVRADNINSQFKLNRY